MKEVEFETDEKGVQVRHIELMMILNCKERVANYSVYHELNNRVERRIRLSANIFDEEGCVYPDKTARKTPLDANKLRTMFKPNPAITNPVLIDNKEERKREETRLHKKPSDRGVFPKEIKPPYYWYKKAEDSTLDPHHSGLVEEKSFKQLASTATQTNDQQGNSSELVEERVDEQPT